MNFMLAFTSISSIVKTIDELVVAFERTAQGSIKKEAVINTLDVAYDVAKESGVDIPFSKAQVMTFADTTINNVVTFKRAIGELPATIAKDVNSGISKVVADVKQTVSEVVADVKQEMNGVFTSAPADPATNGQ